MNEKKYFWSDVLRILFFLRMRFYMKLLFLVCFSNMSLLLSTGVPDIDLADVFTESEVDKLYIYVRFV
jgi:hypothetical protein